MKNHFCLTKLSDFFAIFGYSQKESIASFFLLPFQNIRTATFLDLLKVSQSEIFARPNMFVFI